MAGISPLTFAMYDTPSLSSSTQSIPTQFVSDESITDAYAFDVDDSESESASALDVPAANMSDDPVVLCPSCEKPLPASVLEGLHDASRTPRRQALKTPHSHTDEAVTPTKPQFGQIVSGSPSDARSSASVEAARTDTPVTTESLKESLNTADDADALAAKLVISDDDIRRWSSLAGVKVAGPPKTSPPTSNIVAPIPTRAEASKPFPLLPPPPVTASKVLAKSSDSRSSSRFGFFSRKKTAEDESEDDSDDDGPQGYARLGAPGSDDDDDGYESDKPFSKKVSKPESEPEATEPEGDVKQEEQPKTVTPPPAKAAEESTNGSDADLRALLTEVLGRVQALSKSHGDLSTSHATLLTSLKIARSNLVMAEANTEMLEEELKRAKAAVTSAPPTVGRFTQPGVPRGSTDQPRASSIDTKARPASIQMAAAASGPPNGNKSGGGFGFWSNGKKKNGLGSPTDSEHPRPSASRSASTNAGASDDDELRKLREQLQTQNTELEALKVGKKEIEAELEGLSQALFEEANKMVADERKRRAEIEENLREVKDEREALRQTIKVLGGPTPLPGTPMGELADDPQPRDLDMHYAALRRSIHHVVDGPTPEPSDPTSDDERGDTATTDSASDADRIDSDLHESESPASTRPTLATGIPEPPHAAYEEANPWAAAAAPQAVL